MQFRLRTLLLATAIVAFHAAAYGCVHKADPRKPRPAELISLAFTGIIAGWQYHKAGTEYRKVGDLLCEFPNRYRWMWRYLAVALTIGWVAFCCWKKDNGGPIVPAVMCLCHVHVLFYSRVALGTKGVFFGDRFLSWAEGDIQYSPEQKHLKSSQLDNAGFTEIHARVPATHVEEVRAIIEAYA